MSPPGPPVAAARNTPSAWLLRCLRGAQARNAHLHLSVFRHTGVGTPIPTLTTKGSGVRFGLRPSTSRTARVSPDSSRHHNNHADGVHSRRGALVGPAGATSPLRRPLFPIVPVVPDRSRRSRRSRSFPIVPVVLVVPVVPVERRDVRQSVRNRRERSEPASASSAVCGVALQRQRAGGAYAESGFGAPPPRLRRPGRSARWYAARGGWRQRLEARA